MTHESNNRRAESGNVLFYILIAIALLASLSYAVSQSSRGGGGQISQERAKLMATEIIDYSDIILKAVTQLRLRGVNDENLCFDSNTWGYNDYYHAACDTASNKLFDLGGAGINLTQPPEGSQLATATNTHWRFTGNGEIEGIGTTCGNDNCADLILRAMFLKEEVCKEINNMLGVGPKNAAPPTDSDAAGEYFIGAYNYAETIGNEAGGTELSGKKSACFYQTSGTPKYVFYRVLIAR